MGLKLYKFYGGGEEARAAKKTAQNVLETNHFGNRFCFGLFGSIGEVFQAQTRY